MFDKDADGYINANDLKVIMENIGKPLSDIEIEQMAIFANLDCRSGY
jgi:Ca2+-binding EF-hand superfamily protein